jgi:general stress protein 26
METQDFKELAEKIQLIKVGMFTTLFKDNQIHGRPMTTCQVENDGYLWFFTSINSELVDEIIEQENVHVSYTDPTKNLYISVKGQATLVRNKVKIEKLWNPLAKAWFPNGVDDPALVLIKIQVNEAEIWECGTSKIMILAKMIKAIVTGEEYQDEQAAHKVIKL